VALSIYAGAWVYVRWVPQGMVWAPYFGLTCLLWIGLLGASMATHSGQHLALEMGEKIWPERFRPHVKRVAAAIVGLLTLALCLLGVLSVVDHYRDWASGPGAGLIPSIDWPKWAVFLVVPYSFGMMALRNFARAAGLLPEPKPSEVPH
jgi:TRAP-type C4-dicarboxylate transport system permease small subunit